MRSAISHCNKRAIALVMLLVWIFTVGAGLVNACVPDHIRPATAPFDHMGDTSVNVMASLNLHTAGPVLQGQGHGGHDHAGFHQLHCQPVGPLASASAIGQPIKKSLLLGAAVATVVHWFVPVRVAAARLPSARPPAGPTAVAIPLFIRFRRLIP